MNIEKLIAAAKKIDEIAKRQEEYNKKWQILAEDAIKGLDRKEIDRRKRDLGLYAFDYGDAIAALRLALRARPNKVNK